MNLSEWMLKAFYSVIPQDCLETFCVYVSKSCYLLPLKGPGPLIRIFKIEQYVIFFFLGTGLSVLLTQNCVQNCHLLMKSKRKLCAFLCPVSRV